MGAQEPRLRGLIQTQGPRGHVLLLIVDNLQGIRAHELHARDQQVRVRPRLRHDRDLHQVTACECCPELLLCKWDMSFGFPSS